MDSKQFRGNVNVFFTVGRELRTEKGMVVCQGAWYATRFDRATGEWVRILDENGVQKNTPYRLLVPPELVDFSKLKPTEKQDKMVGYAAIQGELSSYVTNSSREIDGRTVIVRREIEEIEISDLDWYEPKGGASLPKGYASIDDVFKSAAKPAPQSESKALDNAAKALTAAAEAVAEEADERPF